MAQPTEEEMRALGRSTGATLTRLEAHQMIDGLLGSIRQLREDESSPETERSVFSLMAAIEGIRETMPRE